jgi:hypothetical protein
VFDRLICLFFPSRSGYGYTIRSTWSCHTQTVKSRRPLLLVTLTRQKENRIEQLTATCSRTRVRRVAVHARGRLPTSVPAPAPPSPTALSAASRTTPLTTPAAGRARARRLRARASGGRAHVRGGPAVSPAVRHLHARRRRARGKWPRTGRDESAELAGRWRTETTCARAAPYQRALLGSGTGSQRSPSIGPQRRSDTDHAADTSSQVL